MSSSAPGAAVVATAATSVAPTVFTSVLVVSLSSADVVSPVALGSAAAASGVSTSALVVSPASTVAVSVLAASDPSASVTFFASSLAGSLDVAVTVSATASLGLGVSFNCSMNLATTRLGPSVTANNDANCAESSGSAPNSCSSLAISERCSVALSIFSVSSVSVSVNSVTAVSLSRDASALSSFCSSTTKYDETCAASSPSEVTCSKPTTTRRIQASTSISTLSGCSHLVAINHRCMRYRLPSPLIKASASMPAHLTSVLEIANIFANNGPRNSRFRPAPVSA